MNEHIGPNGRDIEPTRANENEEELDATRDAFKVTAAQLGIDPISVDSGNFKPTEAALTDEARRKRIPLHSRLWLIATATIYYALIFCLAIAYSFALFRLIGWDDPIDWITQIAVILAFLGSSILVLSLWKHSFMLKYLDQPAVFRSYRRITVIVTAAVITVDFAAAFVLFKTALETMTLSGPQISLTVIMLVTALTTFGQILGAYLGYIQALRRVITDSWLAQLFRSPDKLKNLLEAKARFNEAERKIKAQLEADKAKSRNQLPAGHVDWQER